MDLMIKVLPIGGCRFQFQMSTVKNQKVIISKFNIFFGLFLARFYQEWFQKPNYVCYVSINMQESVKGAQKFWIQNYEIYVVDFETEHIFKGHSTHSFEFLSLQIALLSIELSHIHSVSDEFCTCFGQNLLKTKETTQNLVKFAP